MMIRLDIEDLSVARGDRILFRKFGLSLAAGEAAALTGRNGAGKTSLLRAIAGLIRPLEGRIHFQAENGALPPEDARSRELHLIGHQDGLKAGRTAWDELKFQVAWTGGGPGAAEAACERLDLKRLRGLEVRKLSAGQRRRLALARLVASPRRLWLLDEPLAPLDAGRRAAFGELMKAHLDGGGMILAAVHDPLPIAASAIELTA
ncbi:MAG TPA: heme ABC exporter ATP-binding protein CcmA [Caulobacteraceae bacterium]|jgi:heme exporter protein A|nr:heme ABC exporter ATP-binding protein CcmA [Caulobacteraceae bacterium]